MPSPTLTFAFILATFYGATFHLIFGGDVRRLALFLVAGWLGFLLGQMAGGIVEFRLFNIGPIRVLPATFGAIVALFFVRIVVLRTIKS